jgi:hypothetical protein
VTAPLADASRRTRRRVVILAALFALAAAVWVYLGIHAGRAAVHGYRLAREVAALRGGGRDLRTLGAAVPGLHAEVAGLRGDLAPFLAIAERLAWLPGVGPLCAVAPPAAEAGEGLLEVAALLAQAAPPDAEVLPGLLAALSEESAALEAAASRTAAALGRMEAVSPAGLPAALREPWEQARQALPLLQAGLSALPHLGGALDAPGEQAVLLLAQNSDELRATGGFISSVGTLRFRDGALAGFTLEDSYSIDDWTKPHGDPPEALRKYMGLDLLVTRDANWWPDFPTSARAVSEMYTLERDVPIGGVVAVDVYAAAQLLEALAPLDLPDGLRLEKGGVERGLHEGWGLPAEALLTGGEVITPTRAFSEVEVALLYTDRVGAVWFDDVRLERLSAAGVNLVQNGSFEEDADGDGRPDGWEVQGLAAGDGLAEGVASHGRRSLYMGDAADQKAALQTLPLSGAAGEPFLAAALSRAEGVSAKGGAYALRVRFIGGEGVEEFVAPFPFFTHEWASAGTAQVMSAWWAGRKDVIGLAVGAALERLMGDPRGVDWLTLGTAARALLDERHIQAFAHDEALQDVILANGWGGALARPEGDYLLVVDSNVGYNKVTASVAESIDYTVTLDGDRPRARLVLTYENRSMARRPGCDQATQYSPVYADMTRGCYWDYVRVYVPAGARLLASSGGDEAAEALTEQDGDAFAVYLVLPPGERREVVLEYLLPGAATAGDRYTLGVQKQAGTVALPLQVTIEGSGLRPAAGEGLTPSEAAAGRLIYRTDLRVDRTIAVDLSAP